jgi:presenilin-like A22 family membrane protease
MSEQKSYLPFILITGAIFAFVVIMAIIVSFSFGNMALEDAMTTTGIQENQSVESWNTTQQASYFVGSSMMKMPPGSEFGFAISFVLAVIIGYILVKYTARLFKGLFLKLLYVISMWSLVVMFQAAILYLIIGKELFTTPYLGIIFFLASFLVCLWFIYPEWWVINIIAVIIAITGSAFLGSSFDPTIIVIGLILLSIYDYIAVIKTNFMKNFAKGVMSAQLPAALIIPYNKSSSFRKDGINFEPVEERFDRGFMILGTGDLLFPTLLAVSAGLYISITAGLIVGAFIVASYFAMAWLMSYSKYASKIDALPGLPFLCTGAIIGYIITLIL